MSAVPVAKSEPVRFGAGGQVAPSGRLGLQVIRGGVAADALRQPVLPPARPEDPSMREIWRHATPQSGLVPAVNRWRQQNAPRVLRQAARLGVARAAQKLHGMPFMYGALWLQVVRGSGEIEDLGLASLRVVTTAGVTYICADIAAGANDANLFKFPGFGVGTTAEASSDTALVTEETTQYNPDNTRPTGSQASSTNTYTTVATYSPDSGGTRAITEHGIFTATSGGTLLDRSVFSAVNLVAAADSLQATYVLTLPAGS